MSYRRSSVTSSATSSSSAKRTSENVGKAAAVAKKRPPLANLTNHKLGHHHNGSRSFAPLLPLVPCSNKISKTNKGSATNNKNLLVPSGSVTRIQSSLKSAIATSTAPAPAIPIHNDSITKERADAVCGFTGYHVQCSMDGSPSRSNEMSMDESMSTCDSFKSPEVEYMDNDDVSAVSSMEGKTFAGLCISGPTKPDGSLGSILGSTDICSESTFVELDSNAADSQLCAAYACDIYKHLRAVETKKRPSIDFMEKVQEDINSSMRSILIDWLVEVAEEYRLVSDTLYLTVNYIDRYLSGNPMNRQRLQLLGVACMMIAAKYEEICAPQVEEFCYITDNTYFREEVLQMESSVLNFLKFEMTAPTVKCFMRRFVRAAQGINEVPSLQLECMANYIAELSLLEYNMLRYAPSLVAASSIFLAKYILLPTRRPWDSTLVRYTLYQPSELYDCVKVLHHLFCDSPSSSLPAIREKYSQHKYKFVAMKFCPPTIPPEFFLSLRG
uniref:Cyclin N-terminal domain-containing protein n=1 Tax=Kalanchoe fedtschenkoi TaxID=63787 RepID=A0A7N0TU70_KALFE